jgi:hypothetical protein
MKWTMLNESQICRICRRVLILKNGGRVLLGSLPQSSIGQKRQALRASEEGSSEDEEGPEKAQELSNSQIDSEELRI